MKKNPPGRPQEADKEIAHPAKEPLPSPQPNSSPSRFENASHIGRNEPSHPAPSSTSQCDVFISYASADRPQAQALAAALQEQGWSVWWDRAIPPGKSFDAVIEAALDAAKCVVVLWSPSSVSSQWVKVEAAEGVRRRILNPAIIDVTIPSEFRRIQAVSLIGWPATGPA